MSAAAPIPTNAKVVGSGIVPTTNREVGVVIGVPCELPAVPKSPNDGKAGLPPPA